MQTDESAHISSQAVSALFAILPIIFDSLVHFQTVSLYATLVKQSDSLNVILLFFWNRKLPE